MKLHYLLTAIATFALACFGSSAFAQGGYWEAGYQTIKFPSVSEGTLRLSSVDSGELIFRGGYNFSPYVGIEAEFGFGVTDDTIVFSDSASIFETTSFEFSTGGYASGFAVARLPVSEEISLHARLGASSLEYEIDTESESDSGGAFGVGGSIRITDSVRLRLDLHRIRADGDDLSAASLTIGGSF